MQDADSPLFCLEQGVVNALPSSIVPFAALALSVCSLLLHWNNYRRDAGRLRVKALIGWRDATERPNLAPFLLSITNVGRRRISVQGCYIRSLDGTLHKMTQKPDAFPRIVEEQDSFEQIWMVENLPLSDLDTIFAQDGSDKEWKISQENRREIQEWLAQAFTKSEI